MIESSAPAIFKDFDSHRPQLAMKRSRIKKFLAEFAVREFAHCAVRTLPPARVQACDHQWMNESKPSDEPLKLGLEYFKKGSYGIANRYFRDAVEKAPEDAEAWIGLAPATTDCGDLISPIRPMPRLSN
jgi:hypothetical protein